mmetsp:Transcript_117983/g.333722  ORF Transcript_117983/g.333722 Transcript_117983/m.333722 type:complete len:455 (+) Transcript_117983:112-1476(+)
MCRVPRRAVVRRQRRASCFSYRLLFCVLVAFVGAFAAVNFAAAATFAEDIPGATAAREALALVGRVYAAPERSPALLRNWSRWEENAELDVASWFRQTANGAAAGGPVELHIQVRRNASEAAGSVARPQARPQGVPATAGGTVATSGGPRPQPRSVPAPAVDAVASSGSTPARPRSVPAFAGGTLARSRSVPASVGDTVATYGGKVPLSSVTARLDRCAIVGTAKALVGRRLGPEIDRHDTVIRVNRLPSPRFFADFGRKTDVYFVQLMALHDCKRFKDMFLGSAPDQTCEFRGARPCSYGTLVFKPESWDPRESKKNRAPFPRFEPNCSLVCDAPGLVCGEEEWHLHTAVARFPALGRHVPTSGFEAFFTFAPICKSTRLYGFSGSGTADGHLHNEQTHDYNAEHDVLGRIAQGTLADSQWERNAQMPTGVSAWLRQCLTERARAGNLSVASA